jgi:hypothetical protein
MALAVNQEHFRTDPGSSVLSGISEDNGDKDRIPIFLKVLLPYRFMGGWVKRFVPYRYFLAIVEGCFTSDFLKQAVHPGLIHDRFVILRRRHGTP